MKIAKDRLKQIIKEELQNEFSELAEFLMCLEK